MGKAFSEKTYIKKYSILLIVFIVGLITLIFSEFFGIEEKLGGMEKGEFDIDFIISDEVFTNINSMSIEQIQEFLESRNSSLADKKLYQKYYLTYPFNMEIYNLVFPNGKLARESSPAEIIYYSCRIQITPELKPNKINPKILLVLLELRSGLIENPANINQYTLDNALEFNSIKGEFHNLNFQGFLNQLIGLASKLTQAFEYFKNAPERDKPTIIIDGMIHLSKNAGTYALQKILKSSETAFIFTNIYINYFLNTFLTSSQAGYPRFLTLPLRTNPKVVNAWYYSKNYASIGTLHRAIDYEANYDQEVIASADGVAMTSSQYANGSGYGKFVLIRHNETGLDGKNYFTLYAHVNRAASNIKWYPSNQRWNTNYLEWTSVKRGDDVIAYVGREDTSWTHLHFEVQRGGYAQNRTDPYDLYKPTTSEYDSADYYPPVGSLYTSCGPNYLWTSDPPVVYGEYPPNSPPNLTATAVSYSQINLSWQDNSIDEDGFKIERKIGIGGTYSEIATIGANVTNYSNTGLNANTTYYYRVRAYNSYGNSEYSNETSATTPSLSTQDDAKFIDQNYRDDNKTWYWNFHSNDVFNKWWEFKNIGDSVWNEDYVLRFKRGERLGAPLEVQLPKVVPKDETVKIKVSMKAPKKYKPKPLIGYWQMYNKKTKTYFGDEVWVAIGVDDAWGKRLGNFEDVVIYSNGSYTEISPGNPRNVESEKGHEGEDYEIESGDPDYFDTGYGRKYQCVEFVRRFYGEFMGYPTRGGKKNGWKDKNSWSNVHAKDFCTKAENWGLKRYDNNGIIPPEKYDIIVFEGGQWGHVGIIGNVNKNKKEIKIFHQNWPGGAYKWLPYTYSQGKYFVDNLSSNYQTKCWLRGKMKGQLNAELTVSTDNINTSSGESISFPITAKNKGNITWTESKEIRLGWLSGFEKFGNVPFDKRYRLKSNEKIAPNQSKKWKITVNAPTPSGNYKIEFQMLQEGVKWFGNKVLINVFVKKKQIPTVVGTWKVSFSWNGIGKGSDYLYVYENNKFYTKDGASGNWDIKNKNITLYVQEGCRPIYKGGANGSFDDMSGTIEGRQKIDGKIYRGTWSAKKRK